MTDIWSGEILLPGGQSVKDVGFSAPTVASSPAITAASLRFLSTVDTAKIPLYLAAGPSYDVWTTSEASEAWFESILLSQPSTAAPSNGTLDWWTLARAQSPIGVLVQVHAREDAPQKPRITEVLFYGTIAAAPTIEGLPTPPSSQDVPNAQPGLLPELRVHALPLSSDLLYQNPASSVLPPSPTPNTTDQPGEIEAQFLHTLHDSHTAPKSPKRKRDLFEEATIAKRKAKGKGGEGVAAAAARATGSQRPYTHRKSISIDSKASPLLDSRPSSAHGPLPRPPSRQLSRSTSISSDIRPLSRKDTAEAHGRRTHLSRVDTISLQPEEPTTESRNKEALTKVVMAAMRMHGLQQRKRIKSRRASTAPGLEESQPVSEDITAEDAAKDEEFKLIYHQTYKGAALALRKHMTEKPLHAQPDRMRDLVEQFLTLFLTDPLAQPLPSDEPTNPVATPGIKQVGIFGSSHHHASPFDLPSGMRRPPMMRSQTDGQVYIGSPVSKRNFNDRKLDDV
ncbi:hypothetical protein BU25DRAFT_453283 [Macroventuria anomochaeta]|uniref:Uncharacterized protein n=1 Tax=Macroventuria anomochaeta TaxID=301207 RepID=A0ACB6SJS7_9PLEO|nr:uncharacterized protein BU25DRAFT_453283 [Macroventuria anomochaeta]KAF2633532.1 hypothetical protein BU25DRAFT_453283 [Macroventuria anomochaeta]